MQCLRKVCFCTPLMPRHTVGTPLEVQESRRIDICLLQLDRPGADWFPAFRSGNGSLQVEYFRNTTYVGDGIQQDLRIQGTREGMRVVDLVVLVRFVRGAGKLVGPRSHNQPN